MMSSAFKILVTSQKGGVGKSTLSANLAAFMRDQNMSVTMIDFDLHGSSSNWLSRAPSVGVVVQHHPLPLSMGGNRPLLEARLHLRRAVSCSDVVICDLTWTDSMAGELMFDFDVVVVPTSVSEMELATTAGFLAKHHWVFDSKLHKPPTLLLAPTRVRPEQMALNSFSKQRFPVSFLLAPPVLESQSARDSFEVGYLKDLQDACGNSFREFGKAVHSVRELRRVASAQAFTSSNKKTGFSHLPTGRFVTNGSLSERQSLLSRHRIQRVPDLVDPILACSLHEPRHAQILSDKSVKTTLFQSIVKRLVNF
jgi:cellulose biosynthesis protein BcsQ